MSTAAAPAPETAAGANPDVDPVDALDLTTVDEGVDASEMPQDLVVGARRDKQADATEPAAGDRGDGRTARGQFAKKPGEKDDAVADPNAPAPDAAAAKTATFRYRALGATHELEGSVVAEDGAVTIPATKVGELREALNARHMLAGDIQLADRARGEIERLQGRVQELEGTTTAESQRAKALVDSLTQALSEPDEAKAIEAFFALRGTFPQLLARAETDFWKAQAQRPAPAARSGRPDERDPAARDREARPAPGLPPREAAVKTTQEYVEQLKLDHDLRDLKAEDWTQLEGRLTRTPYAFLRPATAEEVKQYGVREGEIVFDSDAFHADVLDYVGALRKSRETASSKTKLAVDNARRTAPSVNAPPTPSSGPAPVKQRRDIKSEKDLEDWLNSDEL